MAAAGLATARPVLIVLLVIYIAAFVLGIVAEQQRATATTATTPDGNFSYCKYDSNVATALGIAALVLVAVAQVVVGIAGRCFCCGSGLRPGGSRALALIFFLLSCVSFVIGELCLLAGSVENSYHTKITTTIFQNPPSCDVLRKGVFAAGSAFTFFTAIATLCFYYFYSKALGGPSPYSQPEIAMS